MIKIKLIADEKVIHETLSRIGVKNGEYFIPSCYLYKSYETYYIAHFKELLTLKKGKNEYLPPEDYLVLHNITNMLRKWKLIKVYFDYSFSKVQVDTIPKKHKEKIHHLITYKEIEEISPKDK